ncbi:MAG TPA: hypothetical protein VIS07_16220 [Candidatus Binatia bacterium]
MSYVIETAQEGIIAVLEEPTCAGVSGISSIRGYVFDTINGITIDRVVEVTFDRDTRNESETEIPC